MGAEEQSRVMPSLPPLGQIMEAEWLLVEVARLHQAQAKRLAFTDWLPRTDKAPRLAPAA